MTLGYLWLSLLFLLLAALVTAGFSASTHQQASEGTLAAKVVLAILGTAVVIPIVGYFFQGGY